MTGVAGDNVVTWATTSGDTVAVYREAVECLRDDCDVDHRSYRYRIVAANGEIVEQGSEGYTRRHQAVTAALRHHPRVDPT